jgi:hypothetical protein
MNYAIGEELLALERGHLVRLLTWAIASMVLGLLAWRSARRRAAHGQAWWRHFGIQTAAWGAVDLLIVALAWGGLEPRDLSGAIALDRFLWLNIGLDAGYAMVGITLFALGLRAPRRSGLVGAGTAIVVQGVALAILDAQLSAYIVR